MTALTSLVRTPREVVDSEDDEFAEEEEEESLLGESRRRFGAAWDDLRDGSAAEVRIPSPNTSGTNEV